MVHPFYQLKQALMDPMDEKPSIVQVTMSIASRPSQSLYSTTWSDREPDPMLSMMMMMMMPSQPLLSIPDSGHEEESSTSSSSPSSSSSLPQFPSGFLLEIRSQGRLTVSQLQHLVDAWTDQRVLTTPLEGAVWDHYYDTPNQVHVHQLILPTAGAAWSADAWHQTMEALSLPCDTTNRSSSAAGSFWGVSAMDWSQLLVEGRATDKQFWIQWQPPHRQANIGVQWRPVVPSSTTEKDSSSRAMLSTLLSSQPSCPLATRSVQSLPSLANTTEPSPIATLEQVLRRPFSSPSHGRLETWFTSSSWLLSDRHCHCHCHLQLRQKLPYFLEPQWQSLQIIVAGKDANTKVAEPSSFVATVEWDETDLSSILNIEPSVTSSAGDGVPSSLLVSLDFEPVFLSLDDFPGDPNRGRELPPAMATIVCPNTNANANTNNPTSHHHVLYSNSLLVLPPVPDMSMPFNILSLSCSLYAYMIGTLLTLLVKRASERIHYQLHPEKKPPSKLEQLKTKIGNRFRRPKSKVADSVQERQVTPANDHCSKEPEGLPSKEQEAAAAAES